MGASNQKTMLHVLLEGIHKLHILSVKLAFSAHCMKGWKGKTTSIKVSQQGKRGREMWWRHHVQNWLVSCKILCPCLNFPQKAFHYSPNFLEYRGREHILAACVFSLWKELISFSCPQLSVADRTSSHAEYKSRLLHRDWDTQIVTIAITLTIWNLNRI